MSDSSGRTPEGGPHRLGTCERSPERTEDGEVKRREALGLGTKVLTVTPEYAREFQDVWRSETKEKQERWEELGINSHWHASRAENLKISPLHKDCSKQRFVSCGCKAFPVGGCESRLCKSCNSRRWGRTRRRVLKSLRTHGGNKWRMLTLTGPPRETQGETFADLQRAWARLRAWLYKRWKKAFTFVCVVEVGTRNGLIHMHVLAQFPGFVDYKAVGSEWECCYEGAVSGGVDFSKRDVYENGQKTGRMTSVFDPKAGAAYIAKYATKGMEVLDLPADLAAQTMAALLSKRIVRTSRGFWTAADPLCEDCGCKYGLAQSPQAQEFAIAIYQGRQLERNGHGSEAASRDGPDRDARRALDSLLVASEGKTLARMARNPESLTKVGLAALCDFTP